MKAAAWLVAPCAAVLGGLAGGLVAARLARPAGAGAPQPAPIEPAPAADGELLARVRELAAGVRALDERVERLELRPVEPAREPAAAERSELVTRAELEALRSELDAARAGRAPSREAELELGERVAEALSDLRRQEDAEAFRRYRQKRLAGVEKELADLQQRLGLVPQQVGDLREAMHAQLEREAELQRLWDEGAEPAQVIESKQRSAELLRLDLARILTPDQLALYRGK